MINTFLEKLLPKALTGAVLLTILSFTNAENYGKLLTEYRSDELKYFSEVAFLTGRLSRWNEPITISQEGATAEDYALISNLITELQPVVSSVPLSVVASGGKLVVHHSSSLDEYEKNYRGTAPLPLGYAIPKFSDDNSLVHADIYLHPSLLDGKKTEVTIHEICHTLGLLDHPSTPFAEANIMSAAMYRNKNDGSRLSRLDRAALKLLYDQRMPKNLQKAEFLKKLSTLAVRIN